MTPQKYPQNLHTPKNIYFSENPKKYWNSKFWTPKNDPSLRMYKNIWVPPWGQSFNPLLHTSAFGCKIFENIMKNGTFAP